MLFYFVKHKIVKTRKKEDKESWKKRIHVHSLFNLHFKLLLTCLRSIPLDMPTPEATR
jgi:hypothetical protein